MQYKKRRKNHQKYLIYKVVRSYFDYSEAVTLGMNTFKTAVEVDTARGDSVISIYHKIKGQRFYVYCMATS